MHMSRCGRQRERADGCRGRIRLAKIAEMGKRISASDAKNGFGGLLEDVAALGRVDIVRHGRLVAIVLSPRAFEAAVDEAAGGAAGIPPGEEHMIPPELARAARMRRAPRDFDDE